MSAAVEAGQALRLVDATPAGLRAAAAARAATGRRQPDDGHHVGPAALHARRADPHRDRERRRPVETRADPHQLENAILNIAINGRDAMPDGGRLTIETANSYLDEAYARSNTDVEPGQYVMVAITDTGTGMSAETVARVFDPFFTTKPAGTGTGLGLSQVFGFVKQSHGHVKIYSELGSGTTVKIYLPRLIGDAAAAERRRRRAVDGGKPQEVILVVEDDALMRRIDDREPARRSATPRIDTGKRGAGSAVLEPRDDIALLFTDVVMPDVNGKTLADEALRRRARPQGDLYHRLYAECRCAWRRARSRRSAFDQAVHAGAARDQGAHGARQEVKSVRCFRRSPPPTSPPSPISPARARRAHSRPLAPAGRAPSGELSASISSRRPAAVPFRNARTGCKLFQRGGRHNHGCRAAGQQQRGP